MFTRKLDEIITKWNSFDKKPTSVPSWCWNQSYAHEPYYSFMHFLVQITQAKLVVELGIDTGTSGIFLATASPQTQVISIDINLESVKNLQSIAQTHSLTNLTVLHGSSTAPETIDQVKALGNIDILFIDTLHTFEQASAEYLFYSPLMAHDGIITHDDIHFSSEMSRYWEYLPEPKREMPELHWTGFGLTGGSR
jgi:predicted O-methyltransferase YrrM